MKGVNNLIMEVMYSGTPGVSVGDGGIGRRRLSHVSERPSSPQDDP